MEGEGRLKARSAAARGPGAGATPPGAFSELAWSVLGVIVACGAVSRETLLRLFGFRQQSCKALDTALQVLKGTPPDLRKRGGGTWVAVRPTRCAAPGCQREGKITRVQVMERLDGSARVNLLHDPQQPAAPFRQCRRDYASSRVEAVHAWLDACRVDPVPPRLVRSTTTDGRRALYFARPQGIVQLVSRAAVDGVVLRPPGEAQVEPEWALHAQELVGEAVALALESTGLQVEPWRLKAQRVPVVLPTAGSDAPGTNGLTAQAAPSAMPPPFSVMTLPDRVLWILPVHAALGRTWWDSQALSSLAATVAHFERHAQSGGPTHLRPYLAEMIGRDDAIVRLILLAPEEDQRAVSRAVDMCASLNIAPRGFGTLVYTPRELADYLVDRLKVPRVPPRPQRQPAQRNEPRARTWSAQ